MSDAVDDITSIFDNTPENIKKIFPGARVLTTDEMDHTTPEERYALVAICDKCEKPHYFTGSKERSSQPAGEKCEHCGGTSFYGLISQRTFNPANQRKRPGKKR